MPFGVKNGPPTYQKVVTKAFCEYINVFMEIFLDDFIVFNDLSTHLKKLKKCFLICKEYGISLNLEKCAFMVYSRSILGFVVSKEGKTPIFKSYDVNIFRLKKIKLNSSYSNSLYNIL
jgi:hypothetical protein